MAQSNADFRPPEMLDDLSADLRELDGYLLLDGAVWRRRLPETDAAIGHAITRLQSPDSSTAPTLRTRDAGPSQPQTSSVPGTPPQRDRRRSLIAVAAMIAVVALMGTLLHGLVGTRPATTATHTPRPSVTVPKGSATPTETFSLPGSAWSTPAGFEGKLGVAVVSPQIAYAYTVQNDSSATPSKFGSAQLYTLQSTQDGGSTWQTLPLPVTQPQGGQPSDYSILNIFTQPCSCQFNAIVYVTLHLATASLCAPYGGLGKGGSECFVQFFSGDGGQSWQRLQLPAVAPNEPGDPVLTAHFFTLNTTQDKNVYSTIVDQCDCSGVAPVARLVAATNGLGAWHTVDDVLLAQGLGIDFVGGGFSTILAVVEPVDTSTYQALSAQPPYTPGHLRFYQAEINGGRLKWTDSGDIPHNSVSSFYVAPAVLGIDAVPLAYITSFFDATTPNVPATPLATPVVAVTDSFGASWEFLPTAGIPVGMQIEGNPPYSEIGAIVSVLHDGTVLVLFNASTTFQIAIWKPGLHTWETEGGTFRAARITAFAVSTINDADGDPVPHTLYVTTDTGLLRCQLP